MRPVCLAVCLLAMPGAWALPGGGVPSFGNVQVSLPDAKLALPGAKTLSIVQTSAKAGIDWRSFSIAVGERVTVRQPDAQSVLFNRISGDDASLIFGQLQANGRVFLSNPRGIIFGAGSQVDVGGLVATTLELRNPLDPGRYLLTRGAAEPGEIRADGEIRAPQGTVALVAPRLSVGGNLLAGRAGLAAVGSVQVDVEGDGLIFFNARDEGLAARLAVLGSVQAMGGTAELRAAARAGFADTVLNLSGVVRASGLAQRGAQVVIDGGSAGVTRVAGTVDVSAGQPGGLVSVLGEHVLLDADARIDARGLAGGGTVLVGGDWHGSLARGLGPNAQTTVMVAGAQIDASAGRSGDGGQVVLWSDGATRFDGRILARAGPAGGNGGAVETSGKRGLRVGTGRVDAAATAGGRPGSWLLDPDDIVVANSGATTTDVNDVSSVTANAGTTQTIAPATLVAADASITLQALNTITFSDPLILTKAGAALVARAGKGITVDAGSGISTNGGAITLSANDPVSSAADATAVVIVKAALNASGAAIAISNNGGTGSHSIEADISADSLAINGAAVLVGSRSFSLVNAMSTSTLGDTLGGSGGLIKAGAGALVLSAANTYSGGTTVSGGTLRLTQDLAAGSGRIDLASGSRLDLADGVVVANAVSSAGAILTNSSGSGELSGTLTLSGASTTVDSSASGLTLSGVVSDGGVGVGLIKTGLGAVQLQRANTYSGTTTVSAGSLKLGAGASIASPLIQIDGGSLDTHGDGPFSASGASLTVATGASLNLGGTASIGTFSLAGDLTATPGKILTVAGASTLSSGKVNAALDSGTLSSSGGSAINAAVSASSATVTSGTLTIGSAAKLTAPTTVNAGATLVTAPGVTDGLADDQPLTVHGSLTLGGNEAVGALSGASGGSIDLGSRALTTSNTIGATSFAGSISGLGGSLVKIGAGTLTLSGSNSYSGGTTVSGGTLTVGAAGALPPGGALTVAGGSLDIAGQSPIVGALQLSGGSIVDSAMLKGALTGTGYALEAGSVEAVLAGPAELRKSGPGSVTLSGANSYTGATTVAAGSLSLGAGGAIASHLINVDGGSLDTTADGPFSDATATVTVSAGASLNLGGTASVGALNLAGDLNSALGKKLTVSGASTLSGGKVNTALDSGTLSSSGTSAIHAAVSASSATVTGGTLTIGSAAKLTAPTTVNAGATLATAPGVADGLADDQPLTVHGSLTLGGNEAVGALSGASGGSIDLGSRALTTSNTGGATSFAGSISGLGGSLVKIGAGTLALSGSNSYSGGTTVSEGILSLSGGSALSDSGAVSVASGATLSVGTPEAVGALNLSGTLSGTAKLTAASASLSAGTVSSALDVAAVLSSSGASSLGAVVNAVSAMVTGGTLTIGSAGKLTAPTTVGVGAVLTTVAAGADHLDDAQLLTVNGTFNLGGDETIGVLSGAAGASIALGSQALTTRMTVATSTFAGTIAGVGGSLVKQGAGTLSLIGSNSYDGGTTVSGGTLRLGNDAGAGTGSIALAAGATLDLSGGGTGIAVANPLTSTDAMLSSSSGVNVLSGTVSLAGSGNTTLDVSSGQLSLTGAVSQASLGRGLVKTGSGVAVLSHANSHSGSTTVSAGTLRLTQDSAAGSGSISLGPGTRLDLSNDAVVANAVSSDRSTLANSDLSGELTGTLTLVGGSTTVDATALGLKLTGLVTDAGSALGLTKTGGGTVLIRHANSYTGATTVSAGSLSLGAGGAIASHLIKVDGGSLDTTADGPFSDATATVTVLAGASLNLGGTVSVGALNLFGDLNSALGKKLTVSGASDLSGGKVNTALDSGTLSSSGASAIHAAVSASSATVTGGTLTIGSAAKLTAPTTVDAGAALVTATGVTDGLADVQALTVNGSLTLGGNETVGAFTLGGTLLSGGKLTTTSTVLNGGKVNSALDSGSLSSSGASAINAVVSASSATVTGGALTIGGVGKLTAPTTVNAGAALVTASGVTDGLGDTQPLAVDGSLTLGGNETVGAFTLGGTLLSGGKLMATSTVLNGGTVNSALDSGALSSSGASAINAAVSASSATVTGGTLMIGSAGKLTAPTTVNAGAALVTASGVTDGLANAQPLTVDGALTLGGNETVGALSLSGTLLSGGKLTATSTVLNGGTVNSALDSGALSSSGASAINAAVTASSATVTAGTLTIGSGGKLTAPTTVSAGAAVVTAAGVTDGLADTQPLTVNGSLTLGGSETVGAFSLAGTLLSGGKLTTASTVLLGATVNSALDSGSLDSSGPSAINAAVSASSATVTGGTLTIGSAGKLTAPTTVNAGAALVTVSGVTDGLGNAQPLAINGSLTLGGNETVGAFSLSGTLLSGGKLTAASTVLSGGTLNSALDSGALSSSGASAINAAVSASSATVTAGTLTIGSAAKLTAPTTVNAGAALVIASGVTDGLADAQALTVNGSLTLGGDETVGAFTLGGTLLSAGKLTAASTVLTGGTVNSPLDSGSLSSSGTSAINAAVTASSATVTGGMLTLGSAAKLTAPTTVNVGAALVTATGLTDGLADAQPLVVNGSLTLGGNETVGAFSLGGTLLFGGKLTATSTELNGGTVNSALDSGSLSSRGASAINAAAAASTATVTGGTLTVGSGAKLSAPTTVNAGAALVTAAGVTDGLADGQPLAVNGSLALGGDETIGELSGSGAIGIASGKTLTTAVAGSTRFSGSISGVGGALRKQGAGRLSLSGSNSYDGGTTVSAGTLEVSGGLALASGGAVDLAGAALLSVLNDQAMGALSGSGAVVLAGGTSLTTSPGSGVATSFSGLVSGSGGRLTKSGAGDLTLTAVQTYSGATTLTAGRLRLGAGASLASTEIVVSGGSLQTTTGSQLGTATPPLTVNGHVILAGSEAVGGLGGAASGSLTLASGATLSTTVVSGTARYDGSIGGGGALSKAGTGRQVLGGASSYSGGTSVTDGVLQLDSASAVGSGPINLATPGRLDVSRNVGVAELTGNGAMAIATAATLTNTVASGTVGFSGAIDGGGALAKAGAGTWALSGSNSYSGGTTVSAGVLRLASASAAGSGAMNLAGSTTLDVATSVGIGALSGSGAVTLAGGATLTTTPDSGVGSSFSGVISGSGGLTKSGAGALTLSGTETYSGATSVTAGTLSLGVGASLSSASITVAGGSLLTSTDGQLGAAAPSLTVDGSATLAGHETLSALSGAVGGALSLASGQTLSVGTGNLSSSFAGAISGGGGLSKVGAGSLVLSGASSSYSGGTDLSGGVLRLSGATSAGSGGLSVGAAAMLDVTADVAIGALAGSGSTSLATGKTLTTTVASGSASFSGAISGGGALVKSGPGTLALAGASSYSGGTTVGAGVLRLASAGAVGAGDVAVMGTLDVATSAGIGTLSGSGAVTLAGGATLTTSPGSGVVSSFSGEISGSGSLTKSGAGALTLTAAESYSGATTVTAGTLTLAAGASLASTAIEVSGASLQTTAGSQLGAAKPSLTVNGNVVLAGSESVGALAGGAGGSITLAAGATLTSTVAGGTASYDGSISGSGALAKAGAGRQVLSAVNSYSGGTSVTDGVLQLNGASAAGSGAVTLSAPGSLELTTSVGIAGLSGDGATTLAAGTTLTSSVASGATASYSGSLSGDGALAKAGDGTQALSGTNSYSGGTTVSAGVLRLASASAAGSGALAVNVPGSVDVVLDTGIAALSGNGWVTLASGATLTITLDSGVSSGFSGVLSGGGALTKSGAGSLTLSAAETYSGATTVTAGTLTLATGASLSSTAITVSGGSLQTTVDGQLGAAKPSLMVNGSLVLAGDETVGALAGSSSGAVSLATGKALTSDVAGGLSSLFAGRLSGGGLLAKLGAGTLALSGGNSHSGGTNVGDGVLQLSNLSAAGSGPVSVAAPGSLALTSDSAIADLSGNGATSLAAGTTLTTTVAGGTVSYGGAISGDGALVKAGDGTWTLGGASSYRGGTTISAGVLRLASASAAGLGALQVDGAATLDVATSAGIGTLSGSGALSLASGATLTTTLDSGVSSSFFGVISGSGSLTKSGAGALTLTAVETYSGATTVTAGTLTLSAGAVLASAAINVSGGSLQTSSDGQLGAATPSLAVDGSLILAGSESVGALSGGAGGSIALLSGKRLSTFVGSGISSSFAGIVSGGGDVTKSGAGTLSLSGANRYSGATQVNGGTLSLAAGGSLTSTALTVAGGARVQTSMGGQLGSSLPDLTLDGAMALAGDEAIAALSGAASGALTLASGKTLSATLGSGVSVTFAGVISGSGAALRKLGAGTLNLSGANRYDGGTAIDAGTLALGADDVLATAGDITLNGGVLDLVGHSNSVGALRLRSGQISDSGMAKGALRASAFVVEAGSIDAVLAGAGSLTKSGAGSVSLNGANRYSGGTQVNAGSLLLGADGVLPGSGLLSVAGGTLDLAGTRQTVDGVSLLSGAISDSAGTKGSLSANSLALQSGVVDAALAGPAGLTKTGSGTLRLSGVNSFSGGTRIVAGRLQLQGGAALPASGAVLMVPGAAPVLELLDPATLGSLAGAGDARLRLGANTLSVGAAAADADFGGVISGSGGLVKTGPGRWSLSGSNSFSGSTAILGGSIAIRADDSLGAAPLLTHDSQLRLDGGALELSGGSAASTELAATRGVLIGDAGGTIVAGAGKTLTLRGAVAASSNAVTLTKAGAGTLTLAAVNPFNGSVLIDQGRVETLGSARLSEQLRMQIGNGGAFGLGGDETLVSVNDKAGQVADGSALLDLGAHTLTVVSPGDGSGRFSGTVSGSGRFVKLGGGSVELGGSGSGSGLFLVSGGTLVITGAATLVSDNRVEVDGGATLRLGHDASIRSILLSGTLDGAGGLSVSGSTVLSSGTLATRLGTVSLSSIGDSLIAAPLVVSGSSSVLGGQLRIGAGGSLSTPRLTLGGSAVLLTEGDTRLLASPALSVASGASARFGGAEHLASLDLSGDVVAAAGAPAGARLTVDGRIALDGGTLRMAANAATLASAGSSAILAPLGLSGGAVVSAGTLVIRDAGHLDVPSLDVGHATLTLSGGARLTRPAALSLGPLARVELGGDETIATLSDRAGEAADGSATVALLGQRLTVRSDATDTRFSGRLVNGLGGAGSGDELVKDGSGKLTLLADNDIATLRILGGSLQLGDGGGSGSVNNAAIDNQALLRVVRSDSFTLNGLLSGSGALQQDGSGSLLLGNAGNSYSGTTTVSQGALRAGAGGHLSPNSAVEVAAAGRLVLDGAESLASIRADGQVMLGGSVSSSGDQIYNGAVTVTAIAPISLLAAGQAIDARNDANRWGSQPLSVDARTLRLSAGKTATGDYRDLVLGQMRLGVDGLVAAGTRTDSDSGSGIDAAHLSLGQVGQAATANPRLDGLLRLASGNLTLRAHALPGYTPLAATSSDAAAVDPISGKHLAVADSVLQQSANSSVQTLAGSLLGLQAVGGGSVDFSQSGNRFAGGVAVLAGADWGTPWSAKSLPGSTLAGQNQVSLGGQSILVGGQGIEADLVRISAGALATASPSVITARLWYNDALFGTAQSTPGLRLTLLDAAFATRLSFGSADAPITTNVGGIAPAAADGSGLSAARPGLQAGFVQLLPKAGARGSTAVFLSGPRLGTAGYSFFHDGAGAQNEVPLFYNGVLPNSPQLSGSLSAVASVSETARKESLEEAVRTENVAVRVRTGVIAEVGPGRPATVGAEGARPPASCTPGNGRLDCAAAAP